MPSALINGSAVTHVWDGFPPYDFPNGQKVYCVPPYPLPLPPFEDGSQLIAAVYTDAQPEGQEYTGEWSGVIVDGVAQITRVWRAPLRDDYNQRVNAERDRRIALGVTVEVSPGKYIPADMRDANDLRNIQGLATVAFARITISDATPIPFRGSDNVTYSLTPAEMWQLANGEGVAGRVAFLYAKAWALKDSAALVTDFTADAHWQ